MLHRKLVHLALVVTSGLTALAAALAGLPGSAAAQTVPAPATAPLNIPSYVDNRSDAVDLLISFFNALNRQEYARAYSYWEPGSQVGAFASFQAGYAATQTIIVTTGAVGGSAGAGQRYYVVPVTLQTTTTGGPQTFVGCYVLHLALPELQAVPPFHGLGIRSATIVQVTNGANADALRAQACTTAGLGGTSPVSITPTPGAPESGAQFYVDNRSGALEVVQSLFNAINRKEYARAYGYWEAGAQGLPSFNSFQQGYANTQAVQWTYGPVSSDAGAGQFYYSVPVTLRAQTSSGLQTFVGCYVLHLANPGIQATPPYQPLSIRSGSLAQVFNNANTNTLMAQACQNPAPQPPPSYAPIHVSFARGSTSATLNGSVPAGGMQEYRLFAGAHAILIIDLQAAQPNAYLQILAGASGQLIGQTVPGATHWQGTLPATREYWVRVISNGYPASYNLTLTIPRRISFARWAFSGSVPGTVAAGSVNTYVLRAAAGQTMTAFLTGQTSGQWLEVYGLSDGQALAGSTVHSAQWSATLPTSQDYVVRVVSGGLAGDYNLTVTIR